MQILCAPGPHAPDRMLLKDPVKSAWADTRVADGLAPTKKTNAVMMLVFPLAHRRRSELVLLACLDFGQVESLAAAGASRDPIILLLAVPRSTAHHLAHLRLAKPLRIMRRPGELLKEG